MADNISIYSSMPRTVFRGVKDGSTVQISMPVNSLPIHLPLFMSLAPWGEEDKARFVNANGMELLYGSEVTNASSEFFTHQSQFIKSNFTAGANAFFLRLVDPAATMGSMRFVIDIVADKIPEYQRNSDGSFYRDAGGAKVTTGETIDGYRLQIRKIEIPTLESVLNYGLGAASEGNLISDDTGDTSTVYPFFDGMARFRGSKASNLGIRFIAPTIASAEPAQDDVAERVGAFMYRIQEVERSTSNSSPSVIQTLNGSMYQDFTFKTGTIDPNTNVNYDISKNLLKAYEGETTETFTGWGHFSRIHVYNNHLATVLNMLAASETAATGETVTADMINFLTGVDVNGIPYYSFVVEGPDEGGLLISDSTTHYFEGGSDGEVSTEKYNELHDAFLENLENSEVPLYDIAKYPFTSVWDSGFPLATKVKYTAFHNLRPDIFTAVCTQDITEDLNTPAEDSSIAITLRSTFRAQQESSEFGTKPYRFFLQSQAGQLIDDTYDGLVPFLESTLIKLAEYGGASDGALKPENSFGRGSQNTIDRYRNHNCISRKPGARNTDWSNGMTYAESFDIDQIFVAGYQSMYETQNSVMNSLINMVILCNLQRIGHIVWRNWTGDSKLTPDEFVDALNKNITDLTTDRYDSRAIIQPNCFYTRLDDDLGFSYHVDIECGLDNNRTVEHLAIIARRRGDMTA